MGTTPASPVGSCLGPYTFASRSTEWAVLCRRLYRPRYCSAQCLAMPYGDSGSGSTSSIEGIGASRPYSAPPVEQNRTRACAVLAASSTLIVPSTLVWASAGRQVIDDGDVVSPGQKGVRQMRSDEAGSAGDDHSHVTAVYSGAGQAPCRQAGARPARRRLRECLINSLDARHGGLG